MSGHAPVELAWQLKKEHEHEMLKYGRKYRFMAVSLIFRFASFA